MEIIGIKAIPINIPLKQPFKLAYGTHLEYRGVILVIKTDSEIYGIGEASPSPKITGETQDTAIDVMEDKIKPLLIGKNPLNIEKITDELDSEFSGNTSAKCAVDIALWDILGKVSRLPLKDLLGGGGDSIETSITIGIKPIDNTIKEADELVENGAKILKIKIGLNPKEDVDKIKELRNTIGYTPTIRVDANQGYTVKEAIWVGRKLEPCDIEFIEQPVKFYDYRGMKCVRDTIDIPVMADESIHSLQDTIRAIREDICDLINIKLMKSGGIKNAIKIAAAAGGAGIKCMLGCMSETKIAITAGTHLAIATENIRYADLDGHLELEKEIVDGGVITERGENRISEKEGLGLTLKSCIETE
ncbi:hypothetical protein CH333_01215 [candidate division WOR-3 bacterium JGI_Cruoil_03_44_89]|uniref:Dipeptide epimerase n=1 Tax=candidate division WOR-3 bacterium JGI_Cruoil_03_44_89 TaxID=1973748 RepID=A0A235BYN5_UNCW3|nr:MAG: hypothetical protein CH333_01215 [candidate division WOR-3 bacterium JGI_Cruoil_03_44_89]